MDIRYRKEGRKKWVVEVWTKNEMPGWEDFDEPLPEEIYLEINQWCRDTLGYYPRTAYHVFEFKKRSDLNWFLMRWN